MIHDNTSCSLQQVKSSWFYQIKNLKHNGWDGTKKYAIYCKAVEKLIDLPQLEHTRLLLYTLQIKLQQHIYKRKEPREHRCNEIIKTNKTGRYFVSLSNII